MSNKFNIGDLVKFKYNTRNRRSFINKRCRYGIVLNCAEKKNNQYMVSDENIKFGDIYYQVYWWPHDGLLYHDENALQIISKIPLDVALELSGTLT